MKKYFIKFTMLIMLATILPLAALTDIQIKGQSKKLLEDIVVAHNAVFGKDNLYKEALNTQDWQQVINQIKRFVSNIIDENKNFLGMRDSTLTKALDKITAAEIDLVNAIKITRGALSSPATVQKQITFFNKIKNDMLDLQKSLKSPMSPVAKDEARKLLNSTAMFIETTAAKAAKDTTK